MACDCLLPLSNDCRHNHMLPLCYKMHEGGDSKESLRAVKPNISAVSLCFDSVLIPLEDMLDSQSI